MAKRKSTSRSGSTSPRRKSTASDRRKTTRRKSTSQKKETPARQQAKKQPSPPQKVSSRQPQPSVTEPKAETPKVQLEEKLNILLDQSVAILIDGNNIEMSLHSVSGKKGSMINFDKLVPALLHNRALSRLIYFREGKSISQKLAERLQKMFHGSVVPCYKSADIPLSIKAVQVASKVDTVIILSGDADYVELVRHLKHDGIRVEIAAFPETTADVLRNESDYFFPITVDYSFVLK